MPTFQTRIMLQSRCFDCGRLNAPIPPLVPHHPAVIRLHAPGRDPLRRHRPRQPGSRSSRTRHSRSARREIVLIQPSTTFFVYLLGVLAIGAGLYFFRIRRGQKSRLWWGIALVLWGTGALLAGTSYEAFSYAIKCAGRPACIWTSWWEVAYLVLSVASVDAMLVAEAYACTTGRLRRGLMIYATANLAVYVAIALIGVLVTMKFLISFELLILFAAPTILLSSSSTGGATSNSGTAWNWRLFGAWAWLALTLGAYFGYLMSGFTQTYAAHGVLVFRE